MRNNMSRGKSFLGRFWLLLENFYSAQNKRKYLKNFMVSADKSIPLVYVKPMWYPMIYDKKSQIDGKLLLGYVLMKREHYNQYGYIFKKINIKPEVSKENISIYSFGVRNLHLYSKQTQNKNLSYQIKVEGNTIYDGNHEGVN